MRSIQDAANSMGPQDGPHAPQSVLVQLARNVVKYYLGQLREPLEYDREGLAHALSAE